MALCVDDVLVGFPDELLFFAEDAKHVYYLGCAFDFQRRSDRAEPCAVL